MKHKQSKEVELIAKNLLAEKDPKGSLILKEKEIPFLTTFILFFIILTIYSTSTLPITITAVFIYPSYRFCYSIFAHKKEKKQKTN